MDSADFCLGTEETASPDSSGWIDFPALVAALTARQTEAVPTAPARSTDKAEKAAPGRIAPEIVRLVRALAPNAPADDAPLPVPAVSFSVSTARLLKATIADGEMQGSNDLPTRQNGGNVKLSSTINDHECGFYPST